MERVRKRMDGLQSDVVAQAIAYLTELRIGCAKELLRDSGCRVSDVAVQVGYADRHYFNRVFSRYVGVPPGRYGRRAQGRG